jgi:hypothetical protein
MLSERAADARRKVICDNTGFMKENMRDLIVARTVDVPFTAATACHTGPKTKFN